MRKTGRERNRFRQENQEFVLNKLYLSCQGSQVKCQIVVCLLVELRWEVRVGDEMCMNLKYINGCGSMVLGEIS